MDKSISLKRISQIHIIFLLLLLISSFAAKFTVNRVYYGETLKLWIWSQTRQSARKAADKPAIKTADKPSRRTAGKPWAEIGKSFTPLRTVHILIILLFMNYWNTSQNITIVCSPLIKFRNTPLHQARKTNWGFDEPMYTEICSDFNIWHVMLII